MLILAAALSAAVPALAEAPRVVVTIKPVHALVAAVMAGLGRPGLLIEGAASPHGYALRPSDARAL
ncbi:MAG: zinc ABC transporter substrate-binding protein, partial [Alphaproteobacteria bacterium]